MKYGFDNQKYLKMQSEHIKERINMFGDKLYLEFGGKLFDDYHASRVLPGFEPDSKFKMLQQLKNHAEIILVINAAAIENNKIRQDSGLTYGAEVIRLIETFRKMGFLADSVVITQYTRAACGGQYRTKLQNLGIRSYLHYVIDGYPDNIDLIVSDEGYGRNEYVETTRPLVVVTAPGPGSGKMATCPFTSSITSIRGASRQDMLNSRLFPIWNLPLKHPVNIAYGSGYRRSERCEHDRIRSIWKPIT